MILNWAWASLGDLLVQDLFFEHMFYMLSDSWLVIELKILTVDIPSIETMLNI